jgi:hypothetical protein
LNIERLESDNLLLTLLASTASTSASAEVVVAKVLAGLADIGRALPAVIDVNEAARLLSISPGALRKRVQRFQVPGVVRCGKRIEFNRKRLLEEPRPRRSKG